MEFYKVFSELLRWSCEVICILNCIKRYLKRYKRIVVKVGGFLFVFYFLVRIFRGCLVVSEMSVLFCVKIMVDIIEVSKWIK